MSATPGPPDARSPVYLDFTLNALERRFRLQRDRSTGRIQYPPRAIAAWSLSLDLDWGDVDPVGEVVAETSVRASGAEYFSQWLPWRIAAVRVGGQVTVIAHLLAEAAPGDRVILSMRLDEAGRGVVCALPTGVVRGEDECVAERFLADVTDRVLRLTGDGEQAQAIADAAFAGGARAVLAAPALRRRLSGDVQPDDGREAWPVRTDFY